MSEVKMSKEILENMMPNGHVDKLKKGFVTVFELYINAKFVRIEREVEW